MADGQAALFKQLAAKIGLEDSERIQKLFRMIASEEEARLMLAMPGTVENLSEKIGKKPPEVQSMLEHLFHKGLVFKSQKLEGTVFRMCRNLIQFHDATILWKEAPQEVLDAWKEYMTIEWPQVSEVPELIGKRPFIRVIPIDQTIQGSTEILPYDTAQNLIRNAQSIAVANCTCRTGVRKCGNPLEVCIQLDRAAEYHLERGTGRCLTRHEALLILEETEKAGLVHCADNKAGVGHVICNCCSDCCHIMSVMIHHGKRILDPSRFQARVNPEKCAGCETCLERCIFQAVIMNDGISSILDEKCMGCGLCATACPSEAIELSEVRNQEYIPK